MQIKGAITIQREVAENNSKQTKRRTTGKCKLVTLRSGYHTRFCRTNQWDPSQKQSWAQVYKLAELGLSRFKAVMLRKVQFVVDMAIPLRRLSRYWKYRCVFSSGSLWSHHISHVSATGLRTGVAHPQAVIWGTETWAGGVPDQSSCMTGEISRHNWYAHFRNPEAESLPTASCHCCTVAHPGVRFPDCRKRVLQERKVWKYQLLLLSDFQLLEACSC